MTNKYKKIQEEVDCQFSEYILKYNETWTLWGQFLKQIDTQDIIYYILSDIGLYYGGIIYNELLHRRVIPNKLKLECLLGGLDYDLLSFTDM